MRLLKKSFDDKLVELAHDPFIPSPIVQCARERHVLAGLCVDQLLPHHPVVTLACITSLETGQAWVPRLGCWGAQGPGRMWQAVCPHNVLEYFLSHPYPNSVVLMLC